MTIRNEYPTLDFDLGETADQLRATVRSFTADEVAPIAADLDRTDEFPRHLWPKLGALGLHGVTVEEEYGGSGLGYLEHCVAMEELSRGSAAVGLSYGAHSNLCVNQIRRNGTDAQKRKYLPKLISGEHVGSLAMSEAGAGSDVVSMQLRAEKKGDRYILNGTKMWITNGSQATVSIIWAKTGDIADARSIRGFIVPTDTRGYAARDQKGKLSLRASDTSEIHLEDVHLPKDALLPKSGGLKSPLMCLTQARYGIAWGAIGAAMDCYDEALRYAQSRVMFDKPIAQTQIQQVRLVDILTEITKAQFMTLQLGRLKDAAVMTPEQVSICKRNNVDMACNAAREARRLLGANGILAEYHSTRHMANLESVYTYEGTHDMHSLIVGQAITGLAAFE
jgi:glutaryl-CoA dehydrogenase